jgi:general secretion pathway protein A
MVLEFYKVREQPFGVTPDPRFLFLGDSHREALASLFCGIEADRGFMTLIAHPGMGKTTLTFQLLDKLRQTATTVFLFQTQCNSRDFLRYVLSDLGIDSSGLDMISMHNKLLELLCREKQRNRRVVMAIDEAQNLDPAVLETIRLFSNFETSRAKLLQIVLIGQPQLSRKLADPALLQLEQRIALFARIEPFSSEDTSRYIEHRLKVAGYSGEPLFTPDALRMIADKSQGIPRSINSLCFSALALGCAMGRKQIDAKIIREALQDLDLGSLRASTDPVSSSRKKRKSRRLLWALGVASGAALLALAVLILSLSFLGISRFRSNKSGATLPGIPGSNRVEVYSVGPAPQGIPVKEPIPASAIPSRHEEVDKSPVPASSSSETGGGTKRTDLIIRSAGNVGQIAMRGLGQVDSWVSDQLESLNQIAQTMVRSGETFGQIAIHRLGQFDSSLLNQIQSFKLWRAQSE